MSEYAKEELALLIDGKLGWDRVQEIIKDSKDSDRFEKMVSIYQGRVAFKDPIIMPLTPHLFIVQKGKDYVIKCDCGQEYGDYRVNWKLYSNIFVRETDEDLEAVYPGVQKPDSDFCEVREYYCPGCGAQLEVETVPPGMPADFEFLPDLEAFYGEWLKKPLKEKTEFVDNTSKVIEGWVAGLAGKK